MTPSTWEQTRAKRAPDPAAVAAARAAADAAERALPLLDARHAAGLTQAQLAERAGVPTTAVADLEHGRLHRLTLAHITAIAHALSGHLTLTVTLPDGTHHLTPPPPGTPGMG